MFWLFISLMIAIGIIIISSVIFDGEYMQLFVLPLCILLPIRLYRDLSGIKNVGFDDESLYFGNPEPTHQTPLSNVKSITIGKFDMTNRIYLYEPIGGERITYFKSSIFGIPCQTKNNLSKLYEFRAQIDRAKNATDEDFESETRIIQMTRLG